VRPPETYREKQEAIGDEQKITRFLTRTTAMSPAERVENLILGGGADRQTARLGVGPGRPAHPSTLPFVSHSAKALQCGDPTPAGLSGDEKRAYERLQLAFGRRRAYAQFMGTRPQTLYGIADSPVGLAAWLIDHGDGWGQPAATMTSALAGRTMNGHSAGDLTREDILDDITLYWVTNTGVSSGRIYWENKLNLYAAADVSIPAAVTVFPGENYEAPRSWAERAYHKLRSE
jgi:hypothetical protein